MRMKAIRQVLVAIVLAAVATSAAHARHHGKATANASRYVRQHHEAGRAPTVRGSNAAVETNAPGSANSTRTRGPDDAQRDPGADRVADPRHKGARTLPADRDHRRSIPHPDRGPEGAGHAGAGTSGHHAVNVDLIFVRPSGRDARHPIKPGQPKKAASARPAGPTDFRRQRPDPGATAKNAIGVATKPAGVNAAGPGRTSPSLNAVGAARTGPMGGQAGPPGSSPPTPGNAAKPGPTVGTLNAGHPSLGPAGVAVSPNGAGLSGTGLGRPGSGPGSIGGPAKLAAGISGTGMRPKR
jgi:hypothetical protein